MKIVWFSWKDLAHPKAGGAERINEELIKRLSLEGHHVTLLTSGFKGCSKFQTNDGYNVVRVGNRFTVYILAAIYYIRHLKKSTDFVIDEINTIPFFSKFYCNVSNCLFVHQLCKEIWFYQIPKIVSWLGYLLEPLYLYLLKDRSVVTISESTKSDLIKHGFIATRIHVITEGVDTEPIEYIGQHHKLDTPTLLGLGSVRPMKKTLDQVKAFEIAKDKIANLELILAGDWDSRYGMHVKKYIEKSRYADSIKILNRVSHNTKLSLLRTSHFVLVTSVKEGWCLVVSEANSQGTPAIVYNVDGLRDSVKNGISGYVTHENTPESLAVEIIKGFQSADKYRALAEYGHDWSKRLTFDNCFNDFNLLLKNKTILDIK